MIAARNYLNDAFVLQLMLDLNHRCVPAKEVSTGANPKISHSNNWTILPRMIPTSTDQCVTCIYFHVWWSQAWIHFFCLFGYCGMIIYWDRGCDSLMRSSSFVATLPAFILPNLSTPGTPFDRLLNTFENLWSWEALHAR